VCREKVGNMGKSPEELDADIIELEEENSEMRMKNRELIDRIDELEVELCMIKVEKLEPFLKLSREYHDLITKENRSRADNQRIIQLKRIIDSYYGLNKNNKVVRSMTKIDWEEVEDAFKDQCNEIESDEVATIESAQRIIDALGGTKQVNIYDREGSVNVYINSLLCLRLLEKSKGGSMNGL